MAEENNSDDFRLTTPDNDMMDINNPLEEIEIQQNFQQFSVNSHPYSILMSNQPIQYIGENGEANASNMIMNQHLVGIGNVPSANYFPVDFTSPISSESRNDQQQQESVLAEQSHSCSIGIENMNFNFNEYQQQQSGSNQYQNFQFAGTHQQPSTNQNYNEFLNIEMQQQQKQIIYSISNVDASPSIESLKNHCESVVNVNSQYWKDILQSEYKQRIELFDQYLTVVEMKKNLMVELNNYCLEELNSEGNCCQLQMNVNVLPKTDDVKNFQKHYGNAKQALDQCLLHIDQFGIGIFECDSQSASTSAADINVAGTLFDQLGQCQKQLQQIQADIRKCFLLLQLAVNDGKELQQTLIRTEEKTVVDAYLAALKKKWDLLIVALDNYQPISSSDLMCIFEQNANCLKEFLYQWIKGQKMKSVDTIIMQKIHNNELEELDKKFGDFYGRFEKSFHNLQFGQIEKQKIEIKLTEFILYFIEASSIFTHQPPAFIKCEKFDDDKTKEPSAENPIINQAEEKAKNSMTKRKGSNMFQIEIGILPRTLFAENFIKDKISFYLVIEEGTEKKNSSGNRIMTYDGIRINAYNEEHKQLSNVKFLCESLHFKLEYEHIEQSKYNIIIKRLNTTERRLPHPRYYIIYTMKLINVNNFLIWEKGNIIKLCTISFPFGILTAMRKGGNQDLEKQNKEPDADFLILRYFGSLKKHSNQLPNICRLCHEQGATKMHLKKCHPNFVIDNRKMELLAAYSFEKLCVKTVYSEKIINFLEAIFLNFVADSAKHNNILIGKKERRFGQKAKNCLQANYFDLKTSQKIQIKKIIEIKLKEEAFVLLKAERNPKMDYLFYKLYRGLATWVGRKAYKMWSEGFLYGFCGKFDAEQTLLEYYEKTGKYSMMIRFSGMAPGILIASANPGIYVTDNKDGRLVIKNHFAESQSTLSDAELAKILKYSTNFTNVNTVCTYMSDDENEMLTFVPKSTIYDQILNDPMEIDRNEFGKYNSDYFQFHQFGMG